jgi:hypothetical protein
VRSVATPHRCTTELDWADDAVWDARLARDRATAAAHQSEAQKKITAALLSRSIASGAAAFALTGSTARNRRTLISDLDYHLIGQRPEFRDLPEEIDIVAYDASTLFEKLRSGDDYSQWTLRYGCILHDTGVFRRGLLTMTEERLWPSWEEKLARLPAQIALARRLAEAGDQEGAQAEARATFTSAARAVLLRASVFPLARSELPGQLRETGFVQLADLLERTIYSDIPLEVIGRGLQAATSGELLTADRRLAAARGGR